METRELNVRQGVARWLGEKVHDVELENGIKGLAAFLGLNDGDIRSIAMDVINNGSKQSNVTNKKRQEIAQKLRNVVNCCDHEPHYGVPDSEVFSVLEVGLGTTDGFADADDVERLADLIDRPTCKMLYDESWEDECPSYYLPRRCSVCGDSFIYYKYGQLNYCPNCGAEVQE